MNLSAITDWLRQFGEVSLMVWTMATTAASVVNAIFPVPGPGSRWVTTRKIIANIALSRGAAQMRIAPGSAEASISNLDIIRKVDENHAEAAPMRQQIVESVQVVSAKVDALTVAKI